MKGLFKTGMREEMEGCKNTTIDNKNMEEGGAMDNTWQHQTYSRAERMEEGGTHTLDIAVILTSLHTYHCGEQLCLLNHSFL